MTHFYSKINIPAYDAQNRGLVVGLKLTTVPNGKFLITTEGEVATALKKNFKRIIEIMSSIKKSWECLEKADYLLECNNNFVVKDSKSSSMSLSIALINTYRAIKGKPQIPGLSGTGILRIDGSFNHSHLENRKYLAAKQSMKFLNKFITPQECKHIFELEKIINHP